MTYEEYLASRIRSDLFAAIKYQTPRRSPNGPLGLQLAPRNFALQWIVEKSWERFSAGVPTCYQLNSITSKSLFGDAITWSGYEPGVQHTFGCVCGTL
jgi:hypothetical protein